MSKLSKGFPLETVTYDGFNNDKDEPLYPDISGYGEQVRIEIMAYSGDYSRSLVVKIGDYSFLPEQIKQIIKEIEDFKQMTAGKRE